MITMQWSHDHDAVVIIMALVLKSCDHTGGYNVISHSGRELTLTDGAEVALTDAWSQHYVNELLVDGQKLIWRNLQVLHSMIQL